MEEGGEQLQESLPLEPLWQDREVRFDCPSKELTSRAGERVVKVFPSVEDTKGNAGDDGRLTVTCLRLVWQSLAKPRINLSLGFACVLSVAGRRLQSRVRGSTEAVHLQCKAAGVRYEFLFSCGEAHEELLQLVGRVCRSFAGSRLTRELKLRSALLTQGKQLKLLPREQVYEKGVRGVWNLSQDQGNLGTMILTNVRIVWHADCNELFNLSLPFLHVKRMRIRVSRFGTALVIESSDHSGAYVLGFRVDPLPRLHHLHRHLLRLYNTHALHPILDCLTDQDLAAESPAPAAQQSPPSPPALEETSTGTRPDPLALYMHSLDVDPVSETRITYSSELGLAIQQLKPGFTLQSLWQVVPDDDLP